MFTLYTPSGTLYQDGVLVNQVDGDPAYEAYKDFLRAGNGPNVEPDPIVTPVTATIARIATAMEQLGIVTPTIDDMTGSIFPLAITL